MSYAMFTKRRLPLGVAASSMQKAIRRGDMVTAGYFADELYQSNYRKYVWKRLLIISAEDCYGAITKEIVALKEAYEIVTKDKKEYSIKQGRLFVAKAVCLMCKIPHSREADNLLYYVSDKELGDIVMENDAVTPEEMPVPDYAYDKHTSRGRAKGKTEQDFFVEENDALANRKPSQMDMFIENERKLLNKT